MVEIQILSGVLNRTPRTAGYYQSGVFLLEIKDMKDIVLCFMILLASIFVMYELAPLSPVWMTINWSAR